MLLHPPLSFPPVVAPTLGAAWLGLLRAVLASGERVEDYVEVLGLAYSVPELPPADPILDRFADQATVAEMRKVYHSAEPNRFGHSYRERMVGPVPGAPADALVAVLGRDRHSRRAVLTLVPAGDGGVPCVNVVQFLVRDDVLVVQGFARGQDVLDKFPADAICLCDIAGEVRSRLGLRALALSGTIGSAHVYSAQVPRAQALLDAAAGAG